MKIIYTKHAEDKLLEVEVKRFGITKPRIENVIQKPKALQQLPLVMRAIGALDKTHELCVVYRLTERKEIKVITFFPAKTGRYES